MSGKTLGMTHHPAGFSSAHAQYWDQIAYLPGH